MRTMTVEDYTTEWMETVGTMIFSEKTADGGYRVVVSFPGHGQWEGKGAVMLDAMVAADEAMGPHFAQLAGEPVVAS